MPFVPQSNRKDMEQGNPPKTVGDMCYLEYRKLMDSWVKERRWTTAHNELKRILGTNDEDAATILAYLVFFSLHVIPYEIEKRQENGEIK